MRCASTKQITLPSAQKQQCAHCVRRYAEAEKTNGRWAMAGVAGVLGQELLGVTPKWFNAGAKEYPIDFLPLLAIEFAVLGFFELKRFQGWKRTGTVRAPVLHVIAALCSNPAHASTASRAHLTLQHNYHGSVGSAAADLLQSQMSPGGIQMHASGAVGCMQRQMQAPRASGCVRSFTTESSYWPSQYTHAQYH